MNLAKSKIVFVGNVPNVESMTFILGYKISYLPIKYLVFPLGATFKLKIIWDDVLENGR